MLEPDPQFDPQFNLQTLFAAGTGGYHTYRIPSLVVTSTGTLLAFCEARRAGRGDSGAIDLVMRRSIDGGNTWSEPQVLHGDGVNTWGNPCPVVDRETGTISLLMTHNSGPDTEPEIIAGGSQGSRTVWLMTSGDDGRSWSQPVEITAATKQPGWAWYATGPGAGIQTGTGRLVIPCDHISTGGESAGSHIIFSDDHGGTWHLGGSPAGAATNECEVVELGDGKLLLNMRSHDRNLRCRFTATSDDGGINWSPARPNPILIEPICQGSIRRFSQEGDSPILFTNPASALDRVNLTVRLSHDDSATWPVARVIHAGPAAYSCLAVLDDGTIACLYECGDGHPYERITLARFGLNWLIGSPPGRPQGAAATG